MKVKVGFLLFWLPLLVCGCTQLPLDKEPGVNTSCGKIESAPPSKYCITKMSNSSREIIYYFHGGGGSERSWADPNSYSAYVREYWKRNGISAPIVISVSFDEMWLLANRQRAPRSGLYEVFLNQIIPYLEENVLKLKATTRIAVGESMGGFNASQMAFQKKYPFSKVALLCPGLDMKFRRPEESIGDFAKRAGAEERRAHVVDQILKEAFESEQLAETQSPFNLVKQDSLNSNSFYISCGKNDEFGFFDGAREFARQIKKLGVQTEWVPLNGGHCVVDPDSLAQFLGK